MSTTVNYKGSTIATVTNATKTLSTSGKWLEGDVQLVDVTPGKYTATVKSTGASVRYVQYNGTKYYTTGDTFTYNAGDTLDLHATDSRGGSGNIYVNGVVVASAQGSVNYTYTLPKGDIEINFGSDSASVTSVFKRYTALVSVTSTGMVGENRTRVEYNGQKFYTDGGMFSFDAGDTITIYAWPSPSAQPYASISINGTVVSSSTSGYSVQYTYTLPTHNINIELASTSVHVMSTLQSKTVSYTPSETAQSATVTADSGYDGLSDVSVSVGAISGTYVGSQVPTQAAQTIHPSTTAQTIASGKYLTGDQTIEAVTTTNLTAANIKSGVVVKVGSATDDDSVLSVTGTAETGSGAASVEDVPNATGITAVITGTESSGASVLADYLSGAIPSGEFDITGYTLKKYALAGCTNLTRIIGTVTQDSAGATFIAQESGVTSINVTIPTPPSGKNFANIFSSATNLTTAVITIEGWGNSTGTFSSCSKLKTVDLTGQRIRNNTFAYVTTLDTLILRQSTAITILESAGVLGNTKFKSGGAGGTIYIPKALYDELGTGSSLDYKAATNWSTIDGYGTITWAAIEGSQYENYYADGTAISS